MHAHTSAPKKPVMIIDDDWEIRETLTDILEGEGYSVLAAANGSEVLETLKKLPPPSLILLDLMMPVMNGWEFYERQHEDAALASIPIVVVSADARVNEKTASLQTAGHLQKPFNFELLMELVKQHCSEHDPRTG